MQEHALVALGDVERFADLLRVAALDVAHRDHDALRRRKLVDGGEHDVECLSVGEGLVGEPLPVAGIGPPMAGEGIIGAPEALGIDGRLIALGRQRREGDGAGLAHPARLGGVDEDAQDPRSQRRAALEAVDALEDAEPGLLDDLLGDRPRVHVVPRDGEHRGVVAFDERLERALVSRAQAREELGFLRGRPVLKSGLGHRPTLTARCRSSPGS